MVGESKKNVLGVNLRVNYLGGNRLEPFDESASLSQEEVIRVERNGNIAFSKQSDAIPVISLGISYRKNKPKGASIWSLQVINATKSQEFVKSYYNTKRKALSRNIKVC